MKTKPIPSTKSVSPGSTTASLNPAPIIDTAA